MRNPEADLRISVPDKSGAIPRAGRNCARNAERYGTIRGTAARVEQGNNRKKRDRGTARNLSGCDRPTAASGIPSAKTILRG